MSEPEKEPSEAVKLLDKILAAAKDAGASDIHMKEKGPVIFRIDGKLVDIDAPYPTREWIDALADEIIPEHAKAQLLQERGGDFSYYTPAAGRFRVNLFQQRGMMAIAMRYVKAKVPDFETLGIQPVLRKIAESPRGIILLAGSTGSGKSTTLAAMLEHVNNNFRKHIVTLEDPIEFSYEDN